LEAGVKNFCDRSFGAVDSPRLVAVSSLVRHKFWGETVSTAWPYFWGRVFGLASGWPTCHYVGDDRGPVVDERTGGTVLFDNWRLVDRTAAAAIGSIERGSFA